MPESEDKYKVACGWQRCSNKAEVSLVDQNGGGWLGNLCFPCANKLEAQLQQMMKSNYERYPALGRDE